LKVPGPGRYNVYKPYEQDEQDEQDETKMRPKSAYNRFFGLSKRQGL